MSQVLSESQYDLLIFRNLYPELTLIRRTVIQTFRFRQWSDLIAGKKSPHLVAAKVTAKTVQQTDRDKGPWWQVGRFKIQCSCRHLDISRPLELCFETGGGSRFRYGRSDPEIYSCVINKRGKGGGRGERENSDVAPRHLHLREISAERFVYIGDRVISRSWPKCVGHVGSGTTLENCPHEARGDPPPSSTPGTRFPRAIAQIVYIFKNTRRILFNLFNTYGWIYLVRWTINCSTDLICLILFIIRQ